MTPLALLALINSLLTVVGTAVAVIADLKAHAKAAGATDEQLAELDVRLTAALAVRRAEQG
jgi:hypothetical protein